MINIYTIHNIAASGGSICSQFFAAASKSILVSEINPRGFLLNPEKKFRQYPAGGFMPGNPLTLGLLDSEIDLPIDLRDKTFPDLSSASTAIHHVSVKLLKISLNNYRLFIPRGFALSIWEILLETADQFGYEVLDR